MSCVEFSCWQFQNCHIKSSSIISGRCPEGCFLGQRFEWVPFASRNKTNWSKTNQLCFALHSSFSAQLLWGYLQIFAAGHNVQLLLALPPRTLVNGTGDHLPFSVHYCYLWRNHGIDKWHVTFSCFGKGQKRQEEASVLGEVPGWRHLMLYLCLDQKNHITSMA